MIPSLLASFRWVKVINYGLKWGRNLLFKKIIKKKKKKTLLDYLMNVGLIAYTANLASHLPVQVMSTPQITSKENEVQQLQRKVRNSIT